MREEWREVVEGVGENRVVRGFEYSVTLADGSKRRRSTNCKGVFDEAGRFVGVRGATLDITATAAAEDRAIQAETRLKDAIDALPVGFQLFDADDRLIMFNGEAQRRFREFGVPLTVGDTYEEVVRRNVMSGILPEANGREEAFIRERLEAHRDQTGPTELRTGEDEWLLTSEYRMPDGSYIRINTDISELKRNEQALFEAKQTAEQADLAKSKFLAAASHDLRQPLQALILMLRLLESRASDAKTLDLVGDAQGALDIMARLLNALLDMSKLDAGLVVPAMAPFDVGALLKRLGRQFAPQADEKGLDLRVVAPDVWGMSDVGLLERIIENLLANAVRYTDEGRILLGCRRRGDRLAIEVWDTGVGIAEDQQAEIFSEFHQIGNAERNLTRGLGLGLAIVDRLATLLGHSIDLRSAPGGGSVFTVELPLAEAVAVPSDALMAPESELRLLEGMTALVIEDDDAVRHAMAMVLEELKLTVWQAGNGTEALSLLDGTDAPPDVIFADYRLSEGTWGHEVIAEIRRRFQCQVMAAIITGDTAPAEISEIHASGCRLLYKPVDVHAIVDVLQAARRMSLH
jgi:signal transduction histidine kinase/ActR/RegA family two-component response regulator